MKKPQTTDKKWDHISQADERFLEFFDDPHAGLFVLKGKFGSGKSHYLREDLLKRDSILEKFKFISYTSVFGVNNLKDLTETAIGSVNPGALKIKSKHAEAAGKAIQSILKPFVAGVNANISAKSIIWAMANHSGLLLVIDDIDRRGPALEIREIIGFANSLVEHSSGKVRVILVINENELEVDERGEWEGLREKFIDREFGFNPPPRELAEHYVKTPELVETIAKIHSAFESPNIRTMLKIERLVVQTTNYFAKANITFTESEVVHAAYFAALFLRAGKRYSVLELTKPLLHSPIFLAGPEDDDTNGKSASDEFINDTKLLHDFDMVLGLDPLLLQFFLNGTVDAEDLTEFKNHLADRGKREAFQNAERNLWSLVHLSFKDTSIEFLKQAKQMVSDWVEAYELSKLHRLVNTCIELGDDPVPVWEIWLDFHGKSLTGEDLETARNLVPEELKTLLPEPKTPSNVEVDPADYMKAVLNGATSRDETARLELLSEWTPNQWIEWFEKTDFEDILNGVQDILRTHWEDKNKKNMQETIRLALKIMVKKSAMNRIRAERYFPDVLAQIKEINVADPDQEIQE